MSQFEVTATFRGFSSLGNNSKWEVSHDQIGGPYSTMTYSVKPLFCANGNCKDNEGYVSIIFRECFRQDVFKAYQNSTSGHVTFSCHVSVVDAAGNKRFTQSLVYVRDSTMSDRRNDFGLERYLKRDTLLNDPNELLPGDCLTISLDGDFEFHVVSKRNFLSGDSVDEPISIDKTGVCIALDSGFGRALYGVSEVFRCASDVPMLENRIRKVYVPQEELEAFIKIFHILGGSEELRFRSIQLIWDLYRVADKYQIQPMIENCRQFIKSFLQTTEEPKFREYAEECVPAILEIADKYSDEDVKWTVETYLDSKKNFGMNDHALGKHLKEILYTEWKCEFTEGSNTIPPPFIMKRRIVDPKFEFYQ